MGSCLWCDHIMLNKNCLRQKPSFGDTECEKKPIYAPSKRIDGVRICNLKNMVFLELLIENQAPDVRDQYGGDPLVTYPRLYIS